jgi:integrase
VKGDGYLYQRSGSPNWYIGYTVNGMNKQISAKTPDKEVAQKQLRKLVGDAAVGIFEVGSKADRVTLTQAFEALETDYEANDNRSSRLIVRVKDHVCAFFGESAKLSKVTKTRIQQYIAHRRTQLVKWNGVEKPPSIATINGELRLLRRAFNVLVEAKRLSHDDVPHFNIEVSKEEPRKNFVEPADFAKLVECLPNDLKDPAAFLYHSGCRVNEMASLEWQDIDLENGSFTFRRENVKTKEARTILLSEDDELLAILKRQAARRNPDRALVFLRYGKKLDDGTREMPSEPIGDIRKAWKNACKLAGLNERLTRHDFRRSAARNFARAGIPREFAKKLTGHKTDSMYERYNITADEELRSASAQASKYVSERIAAAQQKQREELRPELLN